MSRVTDIKVALALAALAANGLATATEYNQLPRADCANCRHRKHKNGGHCHMFERKPGPRCGQFQRESKG